jgi:acetoin utilization protein AcuB
MEMNARQPLLVERRMRFMPCAIKPSDSVAHVRALLDEHRINHLPVVSKGRLVGIVSSHDVRARGFSARHPALAKALEAHPDRVRVNSVMTTEVRTVKPSEDLGDAAELMLSKHIGALPVVEHGRLTGIISRSDLVDASFALGAKTKPRTNKGNSRIGARDSKAASISRATPQIRCLWALRSCRVSVQKRNR